MPAASSSEERAKAIAQGGETSVAEVKLLVDALVQEKRFDLVAGVLINVARRALYDGWERPHRRGLAATLRDHQQFGYARRIFHGLHDEQPDDIELRQQYAFCVYKDAELPAQRRLERALEILTEHEDLESCASAETLGLAGAVYKRMWEVDAKRATLENARFCYSRGYELRDDPQREYAGINAAFVLDQLAWLEQEDTLGTASQAQALRDEATCLREHIAATIERRLDSARRDWDEETLAEAYFGLGRFDDAGALLSRIRARTAGWRLETTATQLAALARLRGFGPTADAGHERSDAFAASGAGEALRALLGDDEAALRRAYLGKVGLALSGGGFRASLFHLGLLARLAEHDLLRRVEVLSCVSGGSIVGAFYYLKLRALLNRTPDRDITAQDYADLVEETARSFLDGVRQNLRGRLTEDVTDNWKMLTKRSWSRTNRVAELLDELIYARIPSEDPKPWRMTGLHVGPPGRERGFSPRYENWRRAAKVPILVINATTLNTGHNWQFTGSWMGEPPIAADEQVDANRRLRRMYYGDAPDPYKHPRLSDAVAASACVPMLFPPLMLDDLYTCGVVVELVDGGVHDNQGIGSVLEQDCNVVLVSDASGQMGDDDDPGRTILGVAGRSNSILMSRVRGAQYADLDGRRRSGLLRRLMIVHLKKSLPVRPRDWLDCPEPYRPEQDEVTSTQARRRAGYRIAEDVQRGLAALRTDLDAFSDDEAYSLMAAAYRMTDFELGEDLRDFPRPDAPVKPKGGWSFEPWLDLIGQPASATRLGIVLDVGDERFGRGLRAWLLKRRRKPPGRLRRLLGRTHADRIPSAGARAAEMAATPVRAVVSAPAALVAAVTTRGYLRVFGRRR